MIHLPIHPNIYLMLLQKIQLKDTLKHVSNVT
jgi:hypothetical protein